MSEPASRLPARPSLDQLRKQAKERLEALRASNPAATLSDAQLSIARDYGFDSWPKLVHHIESVHTAARLELFEQLARDIVSGYGGNGDALDRLIAHFGMSYNREQALIRVRSHVDDALGKSETPTLAEVQLMLARQRGFDSWTAFAEGLAQPPAGPESAALGLSTTPPFYRIDWKTRTVEAQPPLSDRDWDAIIAVMREHRLTGLRSPAATDSALRRLAKLDFVTRLGLDGAQQLTDDGLLHLANMPQLEDLDLSGWHSPVTDRGLTVLPHLTSLRRLHMCWPQRVTDAGVAHLTFCDQLESVNVMGTNTGDGVINALRGKRGLKHFSTGRLVTDLGLALLHDYPVFKTWQAGGEEVRYALTGLEGMPNELMIDGAFTDAGLAHLAGLDGVYHLSFFWHSKAFTSNGLAVLRSLPNLGALGIDGDQCDDAAMAHIAAIPKLRGLQAQGTVATDDGFVALAQSQTIEHIWGRACPNFGGRGLRALAAMPELKGLAVSCKGVDDASLATLPTFPSLQFIMPMDVPDAGFRHVGQCSKLRAIWCMYCRDTGDEATRHLAGLNLELYYAGKTHITDVSLEILGRMSTLERIELWQTAAVTDAGIAALLGLPRLRELSISGLPRVTRKGVGIFPARVKVDYGT